MERTWTSINALGGVAVLVAAGVTPTTGFGLRPATLEKPSSDVGDVPARGRPPHSRSGSRCACVVERPRKATRVARVITEQKIV